MNDDRQAALSRLAQAAMNAILAECDAGDGSSYIDPDLTRQALVACLASVIEAEPAVKTRQHIRERTELVERELRMQIEALRRHFEATGRHSGWDAHGAVTQ